MVIEALLQKAINIQGDIEIFSEHPRRLLKREPIGAATSFEHWSARAIGNRGALKQETLKMLEFDPLPFTNDLKMILRTSDVFRKARAQAICCTIDSALQPGALTHDMLFCMQ